MTTPERLAAALLLAVGLSACSTVSANPAVEIIKPGDRVGDFLVTTREGEEVDFMTQLHCPVEGTTETCEKPAGSKVNVSQGIVATPGGKTLDEIWAAQAYEMTIDGRPVDLQAFGYDEFYHPAAGIVRVWNVVVTGTQAGTITVASSGVVEGEAWTYTAVVNFTAP